MTENINCMSRKEMVQRAYTNYRFAETLFKVVEVDRNPDFKTQPVCGNCGKVMKVIKNGTVLKYPDGERRVDTYACVCGNTVCVNAWLDIV